MNGPRLISMPWEKTLRCEGLADLMTMTMRKEVESGWCLTDTRADFMESLPNICGIRRKPNNIELTAILEKAVVWSLEKLSPIREPPSLPLGSLKSMDYPHVIVSSRPSKNDYQR
jgi:hypothetical protein